MFDMGQEETDLIIKETEREIRAVYNRAVAETQKKLDDYLNRFAIKDKIKLRQCNNGQISWKEYITWRKGQICIGNRWQEMVDTLATDYTNADKIAMSIVKGRLPDAYAINHNYATFMVEKDSLLDTSYTLYDRSTVERLIRDNPDLLPPAKVDIPKDLRWNRTHVKNEVLQGILQGESTDKVARRLQTVANMDNVAAIRNARTMLTGAQNAGRVDAFERAEGMGIELEKEWLATLDGRTRHSHRQMDGVRVPIDGKFPNGCEYPGDPKGPAWEVYNCRCTLVAAVKGVDQSNAPRNSRLGSMSYDEWKNEKKLKKSKDQQFTVKIQTEQLTIGTAKTVDDINKYMNEQGWFRSYEKGVGRLKWDPDQKTYVYDKYETIQTKVDLTGCDLDSAKSIASAYQQVFDKYPKLKGKFDAPDAQPIGMGSNTYAWCYTRKNGKVQVNPKKYNNWKSVVRSYEHDVASGFHPEGTTAESIVVHELGHSIDGLLAREGILGGYTKSGEFRTAASSLKTTIMNRAAKLDSDLADLMEIDRWLKDNSAVMNYVSGYATESAKEWFAECFAEYITSTNPRLVATEFGKELEKLMGRLS